MGYLAARALSSCALNLGSDRAPARHRHAESPGPPLALLHASALGTVSMPLFLSRLTAGIKSDFQHKTKGAAAASGEYPIESASDELSPVPPGNCVLGC